MKELCYLDGSDDLELLKEAARHESIYPSKNIPVYIKDNKGNTLFTYYNGKLLYKR